MRAAHQGVPEQKAHRRADHQHHKRPEGTGFVVHLEVQVKSRRQPAKQDKHFVQITHRNMAHIGPQQVAFIPAHQRAHQRHGHRHPQQA